MLPGALNCVHGDDVNKSVRTTFHQQEAGFSHGCLEQRSVPVREHILRSLF